MFVLIIHRKSNKSHLLFNVWLTWRQGALWTHWKTIEICEIYEAWFKRTLENNWDLWNLWDLKGLRGFRRGWKVEAFNPQTLQVSYISQISFVFSVCWIIPHKSSKYHLCFNVFTMLLAFKSIKQLKTNEICEIYDVWLNKHIGKQMRFLRFMRFEGSEDWMLRPPVLFWTPQTLQISYISQI